MVLVLVFVLTSRDLGSNILTRENIREKQKKSIENYAKDILDKVLIVHEKDEAFSESCSGTHLHDVLNPKIGSGTIKLTSEVERIKTSATVNQVYPDFTICK